METPSQETKSGKKRRLAVAIMSTPDVIGTDDNIPDSISVVSAQSPLSGVSSQQRRRPLSLALAANPSLGTDDTRNSSKSFFNTTFSGGADDETTFRPAFKYRHNDPTYLSYYTAAMIIRGTLSTILGSWGRKLPCACQAYFIKIRRVARALRAACRKQQATIRAILAWWEEQESLLQQQYQQKRVQRVQREALMGRTASKARGATVIADLQAYRSCHVPRERKELLVRSWMKQKKDVFRRFYLTWHADYTSKMKHYQKMKNAMHRYRKINDGTQENKMGIGALFVSTSPVQSSRGGLSHIRQEIFQLLTQRPSFKVVVPKITSPPSILEENPQSPTETPGEWPRGGSHFGCGTFVISLEQLLHLQRKFDRTQNNVALKEFALMFAKKFEEDRRHEQEMLELYDAKYQRDWLLSLKVKRKQRKSMLRLLQIKQQEAEQIENEKRARWQQQVSNSIRRHRKRLLYGYDAEGLLSSSDCIFSSCDEHEDETDCERRDYDKSAYEGGWHERISFKHNYNDSTHAQRAARPFTPHPSMATKNQKDVRVKKLILSCTEKEKAEKHTISNVLLVHPTPSAVEGRKKIAMWKRPGSQESQRGGADTHTSLRHLPSTSVKTHQLRQLSTSCLDTAQQRSCVSPDDNQRTCCVHNNKTHVYQSDAQLQLKSYHLNSNLLHPSFLSKTVKSRVEQHPKYQLLYNNVNRVDL